MYQWLLPLWVASGSSDLPSRLILAIYKSRFTGSLRLGIYQPVRLSVWCLLHASLSGVWVACLVVPYSVSCRSHTMPLHRTVNATRLPSGETTASERSTRWNYKKPAFPSSSTNQRAATFSVFHPLAQCIDFHQRVLNKAVPVISHQEESFTEISLKRGDEAVFLRLSNRNDKYLNDPPLLLHLRNKTRLPSGPSMSSISWSLPATSVRLVCLPVFRRHPYIASNGRCYVYAIHFYPFWSWYEEIARSIYSKTTFQWCVKHLLVCRPPATGNFCPELQISIGKSNFTINRSREYNVFSVRVKWRYFRKLNS